MTTILETIHSGRGMTIFAAIEETPRGEYILRSNHEFSGHHVKAYSVGTSRTFAQELFWSFEEKIRKDVLSSAGSFAVQEAEILTPAAHFTVEARFTGTTYAITKSDMTRDHVIKIAHVKTPKAARAAMEVAITAATKFMRRASCLAI